MKSKTEDVPPGGEQCAKNPAFQAVYLPFDYIMPNEAPWFFTAPLSGCDIFVATNPDQPNRPIVIHSNLQKYKKHNLVNLQFKGMHADEMLADSHLGCQLIARVYHKPSPGEEMDVNNYLEKYKKKTPKDHALKLSSGNTSVLSFFWSSQKMQWNFLLKGEIDGVTTSFAVSAKGNAVWKCSSWW